MNNLRSPILALLVIVAADVHAGTGALEINQDCAAVGCFAGDTAGYPVTITQGGSYILTSDLTPTGSANAVIEVLNVTTPIDIDLNGHTINGGATCTGSPVTSCTTNSITDGIWVHSTTATLDSVVVHIHNGTITGTGLGVRIDVADDGTLVDHLTATQNPNGGMFFDSQHGPVTVHVRDSHLMRNGNSYYGVSSTMPLVVENSEVVGNRYGIDFGGTAAGSVAVGNRISNNVTYGILCGNNNCAFGQNTFYNNNGSVTAVQYVNSPPYDMGGNVCIGKSSCP